MPSRASFVLALALLSPLGCGGVATPSGDAGRDAATTLDAPALDTGGSGDTGAPDAATVDVGTDAFVAVDASAPFDPACIAPAIAMAADANVPIPSVSGTSGSTSYMSCPSGSSTTTSPEICIEETRLGMATLTPTVSATHVTLTGTMPFRTQDVPVDVNLGVCTPTLTYATNGDGACPGGAFDAVPISIDLVIDPARADALQLNMVFVDGNVGANFASSTQLCGVGACSGTCCVSNPCACALASSDWSAVRSQVLSQMIATLRASLIAQIEAQLCATGPCPSGTTADAGGICRYADMACVPSAALYRSGC